MSVKKNKPYSTPKRTVKKKNNTNKSFDVTTRIRVDEIRLNDSDSLASKVLTYVWQQTSPKKRNSIVFLSPVSLFQVFVVLL